MNNDGFTSLATALVKAQSEFRDPSMDATNPHFRSRFVSLKGVLDAVRPALHKHGIALVQEIDFDGERSFVRTILLHTSGQSVESRCPILTSKPNDPQAMGSAITYARRYSVAAICGVAPSDEDDDGEAAVVRSAPRQVPSEKPKDAPPFESLEEAMEAIKSSTNMLKLAAVAERMAASKSLSDFERDTARNAWLDKKAQLATAK